MERVKVFKTTENADFLQYLPGSTSTPADHLNNMEMATCLKGFGKDRIQLINFVKTFTKEEWENEGSHPEYKVYSPKIFLRQS